MGSFVDRFADLDRVAMVTPVLPVRRCNPQADASGKTLRSNGKGVEYVVFKISHNGSATTVYCKRPDILPEISRRQGGVAVARVTVVTDQNHQYHVLEGFAEG